MQLSTHEKEVLHRFLVALRNLNNAWVKLPSNARGLAQALGIALGGYFSDQAWQNPTHYRLPNAFFETLASTLRTWHPEPQVLGSIVQLQAGEESGDPEWKSNQPEGQDQADSQHEQKKRQRQPEAIAE